MSAPKLTESQRYTLKLMYDFAFCSQAILRVQTTDAQIIPFALNGPQRILIEIFDRVKEVRPLRAIILKGRRMGVSTFISGRFYQKTSFFPNRYAMQITHEPQATDFLFRMVKRFYDFSPPQIRPERNANNAKLLEFNNKEGTGLNSAFRVATSGKEDIGSGQLIHYLHASEMAKWDAANTETLLTAVLQCIPKDGSVDTEVIYESTAKGMGGVFYNKFWDARYRFWVTKLVDGKPVLVEEINEKASPENIETSIFLPWFCFEKNRLAVPVGLVLTQEEIELKEQYGIDDEQIYWRRFTIENECRKSVDIFNQEHPSKPSDAFLGTGDPIFDNNKLDKLAEDAPPPKIRYECIISLKQWRYSDTGQLRVWEEPSPTRSYIVGADVAEGLSGSADFSCAYVIDHASGEMVAEWHGKCRPDEFALILIALGNRYNHALLAIERNNHGLTTVTWVCNDRYPNIFVEMIPEPPGPPRKRFGWLTDSKSRFQILDNLVKEVEENTHGIVSAELFREMMFFKRQENGKMEADAGQHDDRVMAYAIAKYVRTIIPLPAMRKDKRVDAVISGRDLRKTNRKLGWT